MRKTLIALPLLLAGCGVVPTAPADRAQLQQDLTLSLEALRTAGCIIGAAADVAAPLVAIAADADGNRVLDLVGSGGDAVCRIPAPKGVSAQPGTALGIVVKAP